jgi:hypothetical protein
MSGSGFGSQARLTDTAASATELVAAQASTKAMTWIIHPGFRGFNQAGKNVRRVRQLLRLRLDAEMTRDNEPTSADDGSAAKINFLGE